MSGYKKLTFLMVTTALTLPVIATAASAAESGIGEVLVTATRRNAVSVQHVSMSISALPQSQIDDLSIKTSQDLQRLVPALRISPNGPAGVNISIRGITSNNGAATTGVYLDDTAMQTRRLGGISNGGGVFLPQLFDLERVEVLKGPQGTLYGGSSLGGTIRYITPEPSLEEFSGYSKGEINSTYKGGMGYEAGAAVGGPIMRDKIGFRVSAWGRHIAGWVDHVNWRDPSEIVAKDVNATEQHAYRAALRFQPSETVKVTPSVYYSREHIKDSDQIYLPIPQYSTPAMATNLDTNQPLGGPGGGFLPSGYTPTPTADNVHLDVPGYIGTPVYIYPAQTFGPVNLGKYQSIVNTYVGTGYKGQLEPQVQDRTSSLFLPSLAIDVDAGPVQIKSVTSYIHDKSDGNLDLSFTEPGNTTSTVGGGYNWQFFSSLRNDVGEGGIGDNGVFSSKYLYAAHRKAWSEEIRLSSNYDDSRFSWVVGAYFNDAKTDSTNSAPQNRDALQIPLLGHPQAISPAHSASEIATQIQISTSQTLKERELAGYGELNYKILDKLTATAGVRVTRSKIDYTSASFGLLIPAPFAVTLANPLVGKIKETPVTPKFALSYQATDDDLFYVSAAKGFRAGGVQSQANPGQCATDLQALGITETPASYGADSVWSYEAGAKMGFGSRARVNASVFYTEWNNPQTPFILPTCVFTYVRNIGKAVSQGFDLDGTVIVVDGVTASFNLGYTDPHYAKTIISQTGNVQKLLVAKGQKLTGIPGWQGNLGLRYDFMVGNDRMAYIMGNFQYIGKFYNTGGPGTSGYSPDYLTTPSMTYVTVRAGVKFDSLEVSVFADNLFNQDKLFPGNLSGRYNCLDTACTNFTNYYRDVKGTTFHPRVIGLTASYRY